MVYPSAISGDAESCLRPITSDAIMSDLKMYWFDDVLEGKEADPYPSEITIKSPGTLNDGLHFIGVHPDYSASDQKIMVIIVGECKAPDGSTVPFSGFFKRLVFSDS